MNDSQPYTFDDAKLDALRGQRRKIAAAIREEGRKLDAAKERTRRQQERFEKTVALAVSDKPTREDWYEHPGPLDRRSVVSAAGLTTVALHRLMQRYAARRPKKARR